MITRDEPTRLERRYRRLLRLLPAWYRDEREPEMVAVFLAGSGQTPADGPNERDVTSAPDGDAESGGSAPEVDDELGDLRGEYGWPSWGEVTATASLALRTRIGGIGAPPHARATGDTIRLVAVLGVLYQATTVVLSKLSMVLTVAFLHWTPSSDRSLYRSVLAPHMGDNRWLTATFVMSLAWVPAYAMLVAGRRRASLAWVLVALVSSVTTPVQQLLEVEPVELLAALAQQLPVWLAAICVVLGYHRAAPQRPPRAWPRRAVPAAVLGLTSVWAFTTGVGLAGSIHVPPDTVAALVGGLTVLILHRRAPAPWPAAVAILTGVTLAAHTLGLLGDLATNSISSSYTLPGLVAAGLGFTAGLLTTALPRQDGQHTSPADSR